MRTIILKVEIDWGDYDDVSDELILEDAGFLNLKEGVKVSIHKVNIDKIKDSIGKEEAYCDWYKPCPDDRIKELTKSGALIAAEIDRLLRLKEKES